MVLIWFFIVGLVCVLGWYFYQRRYILYNFFDLITQTQNLQDELEDTADEVINRLEERIQELESIVREAETKNADLRQTICEAAAVNASLNRQLTNIQRCTLSQSQPAMVTESAENSPLPAPPLLTSQTDKEKTADEPPVIMDKPADSHEKRRLALSLAAQGYGVNDIAQIIGLGKGEIMLLLQLNKN